MNKWLSSGEQQRRNIHFMMDPTTKVSAETIARAEEMMMKENMRYAESIEHDAKDVKSCEDVHLVPCNATVIVLPYDRNPYRRTTQRTDSGLLLVGSEDHKMFQSPDSGEMEENKRGIWCCKVIAVGPKCENVRVGDDVYVNFLIANPMPFADKGYYALSEMNIIASVRKNE